MTNPDAPESKALAAANAIAEQVGQLWMSANSDGIRHGMACAAQMAHNLAQAIKDNYEIPAEVRAVGPVVLEELRNQINLAALQVPDPDPPAGKP
ncbi:hypothetical protein SEA_MASK_79 [Mycobacterium phage Mask]|nr:hypothetical protein SEA_SEJANUS_80 [Mycobacterium phage Sejanus]UVT31612.1 hypothetical protein SEA_MASK_79 [Mycobacterium phage Mask]